MTSRMNPRSALLTVGLLAAALTVFRERHLFLDGPAEAMATVQGAASIEAALVHPDAAIERWQRAVNRFQERRSALSGAAGGWAEPEDEAFWKEIARDRAKTWPAYAAELKVLIDSCKAAHELDPENGLFEVTAGLAKIDLALDDVGVVTGTIKRREDLGSERLAVRDAAGLVDGLRALERGLGRARCSSEPALAARARLETARAVDTSPISGFFGRCAAGSAIFIADLMWLRESTTRLVLLANLWRNTGRGDPEQPLRAARLLGLRLGAETTFMIDQLVSLAMVSVANEAWQLHAVAGGDHALAAAASAEVLSLQRKKERAAVLPEGVEISRLGAVDSLVMPMGGWSPNIGYDPNLGRRMEYSLWESATVLLLGGLALLFLPVAWWQSRRQPDPRVPAAGWTFGDLLGVVLPSFGLAGALALVLWRLHPAREFGFTHAYAPTAAHVVAVVVFALGAWRWRLRNATLAKLGLPRPPASRSQLSVVAFLGGLYLVTSWVGPRSTGLLWPGAALAGAGLVLGWGLTSLRRLDANARAAVRRYEGRVALPSLGVALTLLSVIQVAVVAPRRDALLLETGDLYANMITSEGSSAGWGELRETVRNLAQSSPRKPARSKP